ncbi:hypothetical protein ABZX39_33310 [Streptomyces collinus]|uniref:hypothetical protein n=1 Tax=Streptomyces collinus TaxID=42684 RepID=UPI0033B8A17E
MALPWGEYTFTCTDCHGDGNVQYVQAVVDEIGDETDEAELVWGKCEDCRGEGTVSVASIYRALAEHAKREAYPEAVEQAHADFATLNSGEVPQPRTEAQALKSR